MNHVVILEAVVVGGRQRGRDRAFRIPHDPLLDSVATDCLNANPRQRRSGQQNGALKKFEEVREARAGLLAEPSRDLCVWFADVRSA